MRQGFRHYRDPCDRGINQDPERIEPGQVADARNVWAPGGKLQTRPGYTGAGWPGHSVSGGSGNVSTVATRISGAYTEPDTVWAGLTQGDAVYISTVGTGRCMFDLQFVTPNAVANAYFAPQYWNGTRWVPLHVCKPSGLWMTDGEYTFTVPADLAATTENGNLTSKNWIRFTVFGATPTNNIQIAASDWGHSDITSAGLIYAQFPQTSVLISAMQIPTLGELSDGETHLSTLDAFPCEGIDNYTITLDKRFEIGFDIEKLLISYWSSFPRMTFAALPDLNILLVSVNRTILSADVKNKTLKVAESSSDLSLIGPRARYDASTVVLSPSFPKARYIMSYDGRIFAAGIEGKEHVVQWSEPLEAYAVWPLVNQEPLVEADNSPITGMALMGEQAVVFKQDSIWVMALTGPDSNGFDHYVPRQVVAGKGCVSHHSIAAIDGRLLFMAEDGIYSFDGARVQSVTETQGSDKLQDFWPTINTNGYPGCCGVHWRQYSCYLLAVPVNDEQENSVVVVWDYERNAIFLWDNMPVHSWFTYEDANDDTQVAFVAYDGNTYVLGYGDTDNGAAISAYVTTRRFGFTENVRKIARVLEVTGEQDNDFATTFELISDDDTATTRTGTISFADNNDSGGNRLRSRRVNIREQMDHLQVKLSQSGKHAKLKVSMVDVYYRPLGAR